jgi:hypothetical protein
MQGREKDFIFRNIAAQVGAVAHPYNHSYLKGAGERRQRSGGSKFEASLGKNLLR